MSIETADSDELGESKKKYRESVGSRGPLLEDLIGSQGLHFRRTRRGSQRIFASLNRILSI